MNRVRVILLNAALGPLDYRAPQGSAIAPGTIVLAPLGATQMTGVVWEPERLDAGEVVEKREVVLADRPAVGENVLSLGLLAVAHRERQLAQRLLPGQQRFLDGEAAAGERQVRQ